jgi:hypothetical protein
MLGQPGVCWRGAWRAGLATWAVALSACSGAEEDVPDRSSSCTVLEPGELATVDADVHVLASGDALGVTFGPLSRSLLPDAGDVYWFNDHGSLFVERQGDGGAVELRPADPASGTRYQVGLGLAANADQLFVGYGLRSGPGIDALPSLEFAPPGLLLSISKKDARSEVLLEMPDHLIAPITANAERVIVFVLDFGEDVVNPRGFYQVPLAAPRLEPLAMSPASSTSWFNTDMNAAMAPFVNGQLVDDQLYWVSDDYPRRLLRAGFDDAEPEVLLQVPNDYTFSAGPGYIMTEEDVLLPGYHYGGKDFVVSDDTGCRSVRGPRAASVQGTALDAEHVYWSGGTPSGFEPRPGDVQLTRVDVESGAVTRLNTPGFTPSSYMSIANHDDTRVFLFNNDTLVSVRKP